MKKSLIFIVEKKMYEQFCKDGQLVFDVGANIGNRTEVFLSLGCKVVAVEPQASCRRVLTARFGNKINLIDKGLGEKEEIKTMFISSVSSQISSFSEEWVDSMKKDRFSDQKWDRKEQIELTTIENLINKFGMPAFVKIDVEGFELNVLKGLKSIVPVLSFEYAVPEELKRVTDCLDRLNEINPAYSYNYSVGEGMKMELQEYCSFTDFKSLVLSPAFSATGFGDIYVKK